MTTQCALSILSRDVLRAANKNLVHVVMSTLSVALARELERAHVEAGIAFVAAPVMSGLTSRSPVN